MLRHIRGRDWNAPVYRCGVSRWAASARACNLRRRDMSNTSLRGRTIGQQMCWRAARAFVSHGDPRTITSLSSMKVRPLATTRHRLYFQQFEGSQIRCAFRTHLSCEPSFDLPLLFHFLLFITSCREEEVERQNINRVQEQRFLKPKTVFIISCLILLEMHIRGEGSLCSFEAVPRLFCSCLRSSN